MFPLRNLRFKTSLLDTLLKRNLHKTSDLYKPFIMFFMPSIYSSTSSIWNKDLQSLDPLIIIVTGYKTTCAFITNTFWYEQQYKILHRAYIPHLTSKDLPDQCKCPLCNISKPSFIHRLWSCPHILSYWYCVELFAATITGLSPHNNIILLLFASLDASKQI